MSNERTGSTHVEPAYPATPAQLDSERLSNWEQLKVDDPGRTTEARGRQLSAIPTRYWYSPAFLGSFTAIGMSFLAASGGYCSVVSVMAYIFRRRVQLTAVLKVCINRPAK